MAFDNELSATSVPGGDPYSPFRATVLAPSLDDRMGAHSLTSGRELFCGSLFWLGY
jgi:hypothetical protein